jgi:formylglycine-generating enzyme
MRNLVLFLIYPLTGCINNSKDTGSNPSVIEYLAYETILISSGTFEMGCIVEPEECETDEFPVHTVVISNDFHMMKTEVTQELYEQIMGSNPSSFSDCGSNCPVDNVKWDDAIIFANSLSEREGLEPCYEIENDEVTWSQGVECTGWRLPTEAEWEYAARAGEEYKYAGSNNPEDVAWYDENGDYQTHPVGLKNPNGFGLYDMSGNVQELAWDWKGDYESDSVTDPTGTGSSTGPMAYRVLRGGSWFNPAADIRVSFRGFGLPGLQANILGFRLSRTSDI